MRIPAILLGLLLLATVARADLITEGRTVHLYPGPFPGKAVLVSRRPTTPD